MKNLSHPKKINVWSQTTSQKVLVGVLSKEKESYRFCYEDSYVVLKNAIPLGPEFPLIEKEFYSKKLFPTFVDRIPEKRNPAYADYCQQWGVSVEEKDPFVLLTTIGRRGPSTFVFEPLTIDFYDADSVKIFREKLGLNQRDFASLFGLYQATLARIETKKAENETILRYLKICAEVPEALQWIVEKRGQYIHDEKRVFILKLLDAKS